jgi:hypothetical protein
VHVVLCHFLCLIPMFRLRKRDSNNHGMNNQISDQWEGFPCEESFLGDHFSRTRNANWRESTASGRSKFEIAGLFRSHERPESTRRYSPTAAWSSRSRSTCSEPNIHLVHAPVELYGIIPMFPPAFHDNASHPNSFKSHNYLRHLSNRLE